VFETAIHHLLEIGWIESLNGQGLPITPGDSPATPAYSPVGTELNRTERTEQTKDSSAAKDAAGSLYPDDFLAFWNIYPKRLDKGASLRAWKKIAAPRPSLEVLQKSITAHLQSKQWKEGFIPYGSTWLNRRGWESEFPSDRSTHYGRGGMVMPPETDLVTTRKKEE
jgi:hypothetical protein